MIALADAMPCATASAGQSQATAAAESRPRTLLFEMKLGRLLHSGLFNFSLLFLAAISRCAIPRAVRLIDVEKWFTRSAPAPRRAFDLRVTLMLRHCRAARNRRGGVRTVTRTSASG